MKIYIFLFFFFPMLSGVFAQSDTTDIIDPNIENKFNINMDDMIKQKVGNPFEQKLLIDFKNNYNTNDRLYVTEYTDYFDIIVNHAGSETYTGGAECYRMDKKTGETKMIWHEHPMKIPQFEVD